MKHKADLFLLLAKAMIFVFATAACAAPASASASRAVKFRVTFGQSGIGSDFKGPVVVIDGVNYTVISLPVQFWYDEWSSHTFAFQSSLEVSPNAKQYVWANTSGLSTLNLETITVSSSGNITGSYKTQYYLAVTSEHSAHNSPSPTSGWFDSGTLIAASVNPTVHGTTITRYVCDGWSGTGSVPASGSNPSTTFQISAPSTLVWNWKIQNFLMVATDPPRVVSIPGTGWYDTSESVTLTAPVSVNNYTFGNWTVDDASQGNGVNSIMVTMSAGHITTAHYHVSSAIPEFQQLFMVTLSMVATLLSAILLKRIKRLS